LDISSKILAIVLAGVLAEPAFAFEVRPNPNLTSGSVRIDGHDLNTTCGQSKAHRGSMSHARRDDILTRYGLPPGEHPDYEIDHLIPLCLGGSDDPSNLWPEPRRTIEPKWNAEAKDRLERRMCDLVWATRNWCRPESHCEGLDRRVSQILRSSLTEAQSLEM
jgi:hypothetical protein